VGFELLGVVDLRCGRAVRARGGQRERYEPIDSVAAEIIERGDATALARQYIGRFGLPALYVADLDAIERGAAQYAVVRGIASVGAPVWVDAGVASSDDARGALACGASRLVVGLETLPSFRVLESIVEDVGRDRVVFSLDLRGSRPIAMAPELARQRPEDLALRAMSAGVTGVIVLDLARVGAGCGLDLELLARVRSAAPAVQVYAGGGVRGADDLEQLRRAGCQGALVASALLDGFITERDISLFVGPTPTPAPTST
jgi:phosphoribosylformimino-5-aminoimidazole carboxamide ribotide isomerase